MNSRAVIVWSTWLDRYGSVSASTEAEGAVAANLLTMQPTTVWRAASGEDAVLHALSGPARSIDVIGLLYTSLRIAASGPTGRWRIFASLNPDDIDSGPYVVDTDWMTPDDFSGSDTVPRPDLIHYLDTPVTAAAVRIEVDNTWPALDGIGEIVLDGEGDPVTTVPNFTAGNLLIGKRVDLDFNIQFGFTEGYQDANGSFMSADRRPLWEAVQPEPIPVKDFSLIWKDEAAFRAGSMELMRLRGGSKPVLVCLDPDSDYPHQVTVFGTLQAQAATAQTINFWSHQIAIQGLI